MPVQYQIVCDDCGHQFKPENPETVYYSCSDCMDRGPSCIYAILCKKCFQDSTLTKNSDGSLPTRYGEEFCESSFEGFFNSLRFYDFIKPTFVFTLK